MILIWIRAHLPWLADILQNPLQGFLAWNWLFQIFVEHGLVFSQKFMRQGVIHSARTTQHYVYLVKRGGKYVTWFYNLTCALPPICSNCWSIMYILSFSWSYLKW